MRKIKKLLIGMLFIFILCVLFRGWVFRSTVAYYEVGEREIVELTDEELIAELENYEHFSFEEIKEIAEDITNKKLKFALRKVSGDPNRILQNGKANCIGYSALFNSIAQYLIKKQKEEDKIQVKHLVGKIEFLGMDLHQISEDPFFKDHDFNMIENLETGEKIYFDPSVSDILKIRRIRYKTKIFNNH
jgi:hypothetical protein